MIVITAPIVLAIGNTIFGWAEKYGNGTFIAKFAIAFVICYLLKRKTIDEMIQAFTKGVNDMVIVAVAIILATTISVILEEGNILYGDPWHDWSDVRCTTWYRCNLYFPDSFHF